MITNPTTINQCFVRLANVNILGVEDLGEGPLRVHVECVRTIQGCPQKWGLSTTGRPSKGPSTALVINPQCVSR